MGHNKYVKRGQNLVLPGWVSDELDLTAHEYITYSVIYSYHRAEYHAYFGGFERLSEWAKISVRSISTCMKSLIDKGLIEKVKLSINGHSRVCYRCVNIPETEEDPTYEQLLKENVIIKPEDTSGFEEQGDTYGSTQEHEDISGIKQKAEKTSGFLKHEETTGFDKKTEETSGFYNELKEDSCKNYNEKNGSNFMCKKYKPEETSYLHPQKPEVTSANNKYNYNKIKYNKIPPIPPKGVDAGIDSGADNFDPKSSIPDASTPTSSIPAPSTPPDPGLESYIHGTDHETEYYDPEYGCRQEYKYHPLDGIDDNPNQNWYSETAKGYEEVIAAYNLPRGCLGITEQTPIPEDWYTAINPDPDFEPSPQEQENTDTDQTGDDGLDDVDRFEIWVKEQEQKEKEQKEKQLKEQSLQGVNGENDVSGVKTERKIEKISKNDVPDVTPILRPQMDQSDLGNIKTLQDHAPPLKHDSEVSQRVRKRSTTLNGEQLDNFNRFWSAYPKKRSVAKAEKAWLKLNPDDETVEAILDDIEYKKEHYSKWMKDGGEYIEHPATYLNSQNWRDEIDTDDITSEYQYKPWENPGEEIHIPTQEELEEEKRQSDERWKTWLRSKGFPEDTKDEDIIKDEHGKYILKDW